MLPLRLQILMLLDSYPEGLYAYEIMRRLETSSGSFYPALSRLLGAGQLDVIEGPMLKRGPVKEPQKLYVVTRDGHTAVETVRAQLQVPAAGRHARTQRPARNRPIALAD